MKASAQQEGTPGNGQTAPKVASGQTIAEPVSREIIRETFMRHELRDETLVQTMFKALQHEILNA